MKPSKQESALALAGFAAAVAGAAVLGSRFNPGRGATARWYRSLEKPPFTPPNIVFPIAWTALYALMTVSAWRVWRGRKGEDRTRALGLWGAQLALNGAWSPLFFGARKPRLALGDVALLLPAIAAYAWYARKVDEPAGWMMAPYLGWVAFATLLNAEIVRRNG